MKKFTSIIICLIITAVCCLTTGCASFRINKVDYYNAVVAKVGDTKITRYDLLEAYKEYGESKYLSDSDDDELTALKKTLEYMEQQEALYLYALDNLSTYKLGSNQIYNAMYDLFNSLDEDDDLLDLRKEAYAILNISLKAESSDSDSTEDDEYDKYVTVSSTPYIAENYKYQKRATVVTESKDGETRTYIKYIIAPIEKIDGEASEDENHMLHTLLPYLDETTTPEKDVVLELKDSYFKHLKAIIKEELEEKAENYTESMVEQAYNKFRSSLATKLINDEYYLRDDNGNAYNTVTEDLFTRYFDRKYSKLIKQCYVDNVETEYFRSLEIDTKELLDKYNELVKADYDAYHDKEDDSNYKSKLKDLGTAGDTLYYHEPLDDQKVGYFLHTLIMFQGKQESKKWTEEHGGEGYAADQLKAFKDSDAELYNESMAELINSMKINYRNEDGEFARDNAGKLLYVSIADVLEEYNQIVDMPTSTDEEKTNRLNAFINFMFKYSKDDSTLSASTPYVTDGKVNSNTPYIIGGNNDGKIDSSDLSYGVWDEAFTTEGIRILYSEDTMSQKITTTNGKISSTDIPKLCITTYGIHFLYYVGDIDMYDIEYTEDNSNVYIEQAKGEGNLFTTILNVATGETYFDKMFDIVYTAESGSSSVYAEKNGYSEFAESLYTSILEEKGQEFNSIINSTKTNID